MSFDIASRGRLCRRFGPALAAAVALASALVTSAPPAQGAVLPTAPASAARPAPTGPGDAATASSRAGANPGGEIRPLLKWKPCEPGDDELCATMRVPKSYARPGLGTYRLSAHKLPSLAKDRSRVIGTLFINLGGPGNGSTLGIFEGNTALRSRFDLVGWDPRGVGDSQPRLTGCPAAVLGEYAPEVGEYSWRGIADQVVSRRAATARPCLRLNPGVGRYIATRSVARDLDRLREAVGDDKLNYLGYSYGTTLGRTYAGLFPNRVRAMLLDGVTSPVPTYRDVMTTSRLGGEAGWRMMRAALKPGVRTMYDQFEAKLQAQVVQGPGGPISRWELWNYAHVQNNMSLGPVALTDFVCRYGPLAGLSSADCPVIPGAIRAEPRPLASPIVTLVDCEDRSYRPTARQIAASLTRNDASPVAAMNVLQYSTYCSGTPEPKHPLPTVRGLRLPTPPLLVNGLGDSATPYVSAQRTARAFPGSRLVTVDTAVHGIFAIHGTAKSCVNRIGNAYLIHKKMPPRGARCPL